MGKPTEEKERKELFVKSQTEQNGNRMIRETACQKPAGDSRRLRRR